MTNANMDAAFLDNGAIVEPVGRIKREECADAGQKAIVEGWGYACCYSGAERQT